MSKYLKMYSDSLEYKVKTTTASFNESLYQKFKDKKISAGVYKTSKRDLATELRIAKKANMIASPFLAPTITLTITLRYIMGD